MSYVLRTVESRRPLPCPGQQTLLRRWDITGHFEVVAVAQRTTAHDALDDIEVRPAIAAQTDLATTTTVCRAPFQPQCLLATGRIRCNCCQWRVEMVPFAGEVAAVGVQWTEDIVVFGLVRTVCEWISQGGWRRHLHVCESERKGAQRTDGGKRSHGEYGQHTLGCKDALRDGTTW